jgi:hypothetical protein
MKRKIAIDLGGDSYDASGPNAVELGDGSKAAADMASGWLLSSPPFYSKL